jgi:hypothetical protein
VHDDLLFVMAAFAGFASLVAAISRRGDDSPEQVEYDFRTLRNVLLLSLQAILYALAPVLLARQGLSTEFAFRASGVLMFVAGGVYVLFTLSALPAAYGQLGRTVPLSFKLNAGVVIGGILSQGASALGWIPTDTYVLAIAGFLYCAGFGFVRLFVSLRPV